MESRSTYKEICPFCGRERTCTTVSDDGRDFYGHARGRGDSYTIDNGCNCQFARLCRSQEKALIKPMCMNCAFNKEGYCKNAEELERLNEMFAISKLYISTPYLKCDFWELNKDILEDVIEIIE